MSEHFPRFHSSELCGRRYQSKVTRLTCSQARGNSIWKIRYELKVCTTLHRMLIDEWIEMVCSQLHFWYEIRHQTSFNVLLPAISLAFYNYVCMHSYFFQLTCNVHTPLFCLVEIHFLRFYFVLLTPLWAIFSQADCLRWTNKSITSDECSALFVGAFLQQVWLTIIIWNIGMRTAHVTLR